MNAGTDGGGLALQWLAAVGLGGHALSMAVAWLLPVVSEFSLVGDNVSELALGRYGSVQTMAFLAAGVGTLAIAVGIRRTTAGVRGSALGSALVAVFGCGALLEALFPTDRIDDAADLRHLSTIGLVHILVALGSFLCVVAGMVVLAGTFGRSNAWQDRRAASRWLGAAALASMLLQAEGPAVGILQRLLIAVVTAWLVLVAARIRRLAHPGSTAATSRQLRVTA